LQVRADDVTSAIFVRQDSDHTTVVSPHVRAQKAVTDELQVYAGYSADVWTSASIDIRASASVKPVTEQRDELNVGLIQSWSDLSLGVSYRFSTEADYLSNGGSVEAHYNLANKAATLSASLHLFADVVGRS
jgi:hypothetical protein